MLLVEKIWNQPALFVTAVVFYLSVQYLAYLFKRSKRLKIKELWVYPIKSCKGISAKNLEVTKIGFKYDRCFMVVDSNLKFVSQRTHPRLALVHVDILESKGVLEVKAPRMSDVLHIPLQEPRVNEVLTVNVWGDEIEATEVHEDISRWFNTFLGTKDFKFVRKANHFVRKTDPKYAPKGQTAFSDGYPFLLCSTESLKDLNDNLEKPVSLTNFRPNIVVQGCDFAYEEDTWKKITINGLNFNVVKPCARCKMPTVDPNTGVLDSNNEPMRSMKAFRKGDEIGLDKVNPRWKGEIFFGQNLDHESNEEGLVLHVGQVCTVQKK